MKRRLGALAGASAILAAAAPILAMPLFTCSDGFDNDNDNLVDYPNDAGCASMWDSTEEGPFFRYVDCFHPLPHGHVYGTSRAPGSKSHAVTIGGVVASGFVLVWDDSVVDCDRNGEPIDFDGDHETGVAGGFFGHGPWADEPACAYGLRAHGAAVAIQDAVFGDGVAFVIGADDTSGPAIATDPVTGETTCSTDGRITPGDPEADPAADPDDCLSPLYVGTGVACGAGGDGGYWVVLVGSFVAGDPETPGVGNPATTGTLTA